MKKPSLVLLLLIVGLVSSISAGCVLAWQTPVSERDETDQTTTDVEGSPLAEWARDLAIEYVLQEYDVLKGVEAPSSWEARDLTPGLIGGANLQYTGGGWTVNVSYPIVPDPICTVEISYRNGVVFDWQGPVDHNGKV